jgi:hypothetical protein
MVAAGAAAPVLPIAGIPLPRWLGSHATTTQEVLKRDDVFACRSPSVMDLSDGHNFLLGMEANQSTAGCSAAHEVFRHEDIAAIVTPLSAKLSEEILDSSEGEPTRSRA